MPAHSNPNVTPAMAEGVFRDTFPGRLGIELLEIDDERVVGRMVVDDRHLHAGGFVHGGAWVAFADTIAAWGTFRRLPPGYDFTTVELKTNVFIGARTGDVLDAFGRPVHLGRRTQVWEVEIKVGERAAALFVCTQMVLEPDQASPFVAEVGGG